MNEVIFNLYAENDWRRVLIIKNGYKA